MNKFREADLEYTIKNYGNLIYRTCFFMLRNSHDAEDVMQETFYKYMLSEMEFNDEEHKKAWLLKVSQNQCRNILKYKKIHPYMSYEDVEEVLLGKQEPVKEDIEEIIKVSNLSYDYKSVVMLYYYEDYSVNEIADILNISPSAVKKRLQRARQKLKIAYEKVNEEGGRVNELQ